MKFLSESRPFSEKIILCNRSILDIFDQKYHFGTYNQKFPYSKKVFLPSEILSGIYRFRNSKEVNPKMYIMILTNELRLFSEYFVWFSSI